MKLLKTMFNPWGLLVAFFLMVAVSAQTTNSPAMTSPPTVLDTKTLLMLAIALVTPFCVRGLSELGVPKKLLPLTTPIIGCAIGALLNWLANAGLAGLDMATAGGLAVAIREAWDQNIAKALNEPTKDDWEKLGKALNKESDPDGRRD